MTRSWHWDVWRMLATVCFRFATMGFSLQSGRICWFCCGRKDPWYPIEAGLSVLIGVRYEVEDSIDIVCTIVLEQREPSLPVKLKYR